MTKKPKPPEEPPSHYEVGRGKPPKQTRFAPGQSGNPGGRKKGDQNTKTVFKEVMDSQICLTEQGKPRSISMLKAVILSSAQNAIKGNQRACEFLIEKSEALDEEHRETISELSEDDALLLEAYTASRLSASAWGLVPQHRSLSDALVEFDRLDNANAQGIADDQEPV